MTTSGQSDRVAAQAALFVLQTAVEQDGGGAIAAYLMSPDTGALSRHEAVEYLLRTSKPIDCKARRLADQLVVSCEPVHPFALALRPARTAEHVRFLRWLMRGAQRSRPRAHLIELRGGEERMPLSLDDYQRLEEDYDLGLASGGLSRGTSLAAPDDAPDTIGLVTTILRSEGSNVKIEILRDPTPEQMRLFDERTRLQERKLHRPVLEAVVEETEYESPAHYVATLTHTVLRHADEAASGERDAEAHLRVADALTLLRNDDPAGAALVSLLAACDPVSGPDPALWPMRLVDLARTLEADAPDRPALPKIAAHLRALAAAV